MMIDYLSTHQSASLVRRVAEPSDCSEDLGVKVVFHYTPKHSSWLSIFVRKVLKRGSFASVEELENKVLAFIRYYNYTAKPFR